MQNWVKRKKNAKFPIKDIDIETFYCPNADNVGIITEDEKVIMILTIFFIIIFNVY